MKIETQIREDHQAKLTVEVEAERLESLKQRAAAKIARKVRVPGFRPGKAPYHVIVRQVGEASIVEEAVEMLVEEIYPEAIQQADIHPYAAGQLENISSMDPVTLEFLVPLEPTIDLGDYQSIRKSYELQEITDEDVERVVRDLQERQAMIEPVERPAQAGDLATVRMAAVRRPQAEAETAEGEETAPKDLTLIRERSMPLVVYTADDPDAAGEWPYPGFSSLLIGKSAGDELNTEYTWPEDSEQENLRGVTTDFKATLEAVKARILPEANDEFAAGLEGDFEDMAGLRKDIRQMLESQSREAYDQSYDDAILEEAISQATYHYPPQIVEREIDTVIHDLEHRLEHQNMDLGLYLKTRNMDEAALRAEVRPVAESRIKRALFLVEYGKQSQIEVQPEELQKEAIQTMRYLYNSLPEKETRKLSERDVYTNVVNNVLAEMLSKRAMESFRNLASGRQEAASAAQAAAAETPLAPVEEPTSGETPE